MLLALLAPWSICSGKNVVAPTSNCFIARVLVISGCFVLVTFSCFFRVFFTCKRDGSFISVQALIFWSSRVDIWSLSIATGRSQFCFGHDSGLQVQGHVFAQQTLHADFFLWLSFFASIGA